MTFESYCDPNGDGTIQWGIGGGESTHWESILSTTRYPDNPGTSTQINVVDGDESVVDNINMGSISEVKEVTKVKAWIYGNQNCVNDPTINLYMDGWEGAKTMDLSAGDDWFSYEWTGSWSQAQLDGMVIKFTAPSAIGELEGVWVYTLYCEVTYSMVYPIIVEGSPNKILSIEGSPDKQLIASNKT